MEGGASGTTGLSPVATGEGDEEAWISVAPPPPESPPPPPPPLPPRLCFEAFFAASLALSARNLAPRLPPPLLLDCAEIAEVEEEVEVSPEEDEAFDDRRALSSLPANSFFKFIYYLFILDFEIGEFFFPASFYFVQRASRDEAPLKREKRGAEREKRRRGGFPLNRPLSPPPPSSEIRATFRCFMFALAHAYTSFTH